MLKLKDKIDEAFGSVEEMKKKFTEAAVNRFGSGWAWLGVKTDGSLAISSTANQGFFLRKFLILILITVIYLL